LNFLYDFDEPEIIEGGTKARINTVFWTNDTALKMFELYPEVLVFDTTYKTNVSQMPLGCFIGVDNRNTSFIIGMVLINSEKTEAFSFALRSLLQKSRVAPSLIKTIFTDFDTGIRKGFGETLPDVDILVCRWHVKKNVIAAVCSKYGYTKHHKKEIDDAMNLFDALAFERDVPEFVRKAGEFITKYSLAQETINRWWGRALVWAECYTKECIRLGIVSTQRAETNHAALKWHIEATSHLNVLVSTVDNMIISRKTIT
jgi:hypothetical protein